MDKMTIIDNAFCSTWCFPTKRLMQHQWHKFCYGEDFRNVMTQAAEAFEKYNCIKWLSDDRNFGAIHPDDEAWGKAYWFPRVLTAGWKYHAMVLPVSIIGHMSLTAMVDFFAEQGVQAKVFSDPDEAMKWLDSKGTLGIELNPSKP
jgi:hypothetical protein